MLQCEEGTYHSYRKKIPPYLFYILITNLCSQHHYLPKDKNKKLVYKRNEADCLIS
jgi:hypothetical protein